MSRAESTFDRAAQPPMVVLLHSSASSGRQWEGLRQALEPRFRVRAIDFHGHGGQASWRGGAPLTLADDAALVEPLLAEGGGVHIVGHSYGGAVALKFASAHPGLVRSVAVYEPVPFRWLHDAGIGREPARDIVAVADAIRANLAAGQDAAAAQGFIDFWSGAGAWKSLSAGKRDTIAARMPDVLRNFDALFRDPLQPAELACLATPMLILTGTHTVAVTRCLGELARAALPRARHEFLQGAAHMGPLTHAAEFNARVAAFLRAHAGSDVEVESLRAVA